MIPLPDRSYTIIYADPPWSYRDKAHAGQRGVAYKYPVLSDAEIMQLPIPSITNNDAALFLWATPPRLPSALAVISAWGFTFKTVAFVWVKTVANGGWAWGMGNWTRANPELVLLGIRGRPTRQSASVHSVIRAPRGAHSAKPPVVRDSIVQLLGDVPRIELFARERPVGWDVWGSDVMDAYDA